MENKIYELPKMSSRQLRKLAKKAMVLAHDLERAEPSYELAILNGVRDDSYRVQSGEVCAYSGTAIVTLENGSKWKCVGRGAGGNEYFATNGYIEFFPIQD